MRIAICDDKEQYVNQIHTYITDYFKYYKLKNIIIDCFDNGENLLSSDNIYDIAFLDVELSGLSGIHVGNELKKKNPKLIFFVITAYPEYLDEALHFHAFRYLSKPIDKNRLLRNLKDALYVYNTQSKKIAVETKNTTYTIFTSEIIMIEAIHRKVIIHTTNTDYLSIKPLKYWMEALKELPFFQTHKSFIVNFEHVLKFDASLVYLINDYNAYLTQRKYTDFKHNYMIYLDTTI